MNWINLWIKYFADYIYTKLPSIWYHNSYFNKCKKYQGVKEKKHDFEMSMPSCRICCSIMVHFKGVPIIKSCSPSLTP